MNPGTIVFRVMITLIVAAGALVCGFTLWRYYVDSPWTRDARVAAEFVIVAPDVSGWITDLRVVNNQWVNKGDVLFTIDQDRFVIAQQQAQASLDQEIAQSEEFDREYQRRLQLHNDAISQEGVEQAGSRAKTARAQVEADQAALAKAKLDLERTTVRAPVNGYITTLILRKGDYATGGRSLLTMINADTFHVRGYFEETKIRYIKPNDRVIIRLMGFSQPLDGHVESIDRAIVDREVTVDQLTQVVNVNPTFSWVRLAQRFSVRIAIDKVPEGVLLASGMTATVEVIPTPDKGAAAVGDVKKRQSQ